VIVEKGTLMLVDVAVSGDRNMIKKKAAKIVKCNENPIPRIASISA
jgi:hypothetical protein